MQEGRFEFHAITASTRLNGIPRVDLLGRSGGSETARDWKVTSGVDFGERLLAVLVLFTFSYDRS